MPMFSRYRLFSQQADIHAANDAATVALTPLQTSLVVVDQIIAVLAGVVLLVVIARRITRDTPLLAGAPRRANTMREDGVALAAVCYLAGVLLLAGIVQLAGFDPQGQVATLLVGVGAQVGGAIACVLVASRRFEGGGRAFIFGPGAPRLTRHVWLVVVTAFVGVGLCPVIAEVSVAGLTWFDPTYVAPNHATLAALEENGVPLWLVISLWFGAACVAPVAEEFFFRGLLQTMLLGTLGSRWRAIVLTSIAFGMVHFPQPHAVPALIFLAIILGYAYERSGTIMVPVAIHALFNLKTLIWEAIGNLPG